ncbi:glycoside hydrolase TIM-barrel-like domain-containing protein [uncultured Microscilla sp.]|uniref:glycoside hydrolase family 113 n=1 Tax=uncultured Microscilla sp. TaxID=432653 RepID=UPI002629B03A|nr:glycoside hydrolase TIM-barrel-like domain-containing protein [uncultured Microscilla sp.]
MDQVLKHWGWAVWVAIWVTACQTSPKTEAKHTKPQNEEVIHRLTKKIDGVSFVSAAQPPNDQTFAPIRQRVYADWVALVPYAFCFKDSTQIHFDTPRQWQGETTQGMIAYAKYARKQHLKLMFKPHLWIIRGGFTGALNFDSTTQWQAWAKSYEAYILHYAHLADSLQVELFCIGTELESFVKAQPQFWQQLIEKIRKVYRGKLTYAANWDEYKRFPYWAMLDYIGIDAYFPLAKAATPTLPQLKAGWQHWLHEISQVQKHYHKSVLFTEFGYRSINYTAHKPWESGNHRQKVNLAGQAQALEALFQVFMPQPWFAGGFVWKWFDEGVHRIDVTTHTGYSPQHKPAEQVLNLWYKKMGDASFATQ